MFVLLFVMLLIHETLGSRADDLLRYDILIINITNAVSDHFLTKCLTIIVSSNYTSIENIRNFRIAKLLSMDYDFGKSVVVKTFSSYTDHIKFKYNKNRCARVLNLVLGYDDVVRKEMEMFPRQEQMQGPVWLFFLDWNTDPVDFFRNVNITFDIELITAKNKEDDVQLYELYRVSHQHPVRSQAFGHWTAKDGLKAPGNQSPYSRRFDLEGIVLTAGFYDQDETTLKHSNQSEIKQIGGYFGNVWKGLEERLNFTTRFTRSRDNLFGRSNPQGNWTGLLGMAERKEVDAIVAEMTMITERMKVVDFLRPIFITTLNVFSRAPGTFTEWDFILRPFDVRTWIAFASVIFLIAVSLKIVNKYDFEAKALRENESQFLQSLFFVISAITHQGNSLIPGSYSCRIIIFTMYFLSIILLAAYSGALTSFITVEKPQKPFDSLKTMLEDGTYTLEQIPDSSGFTYFSDSTAPVLQTVYQKLFSKLPADKLPKNDTEAFERICTKKNVAYFGEYGILELAAREFIEKKNCQIVTMDEPVGKVYMSFVVPKDSPYKGILDYELARMEYLGILKKYRDDTWGLHKNLNPSENKFHVVSVDQVSKVYYFLLLGHMLSVFLVAAEIFHKRNQTLKKEKSQKEFFR